jgi:hypothetical protein
MFKLIPFKTLRLVEPSKVFIIPIASIKMKIALLYLPQI